ncbi:MAG TPA: DoxX family protein [Gammaproteobacteria bacterium]
MSIRPARVAYALVLIGLGITGLVNGGFALVWQDVPKGVPAYTALSYLCAVVELLAGLGLLFKPTLTQAARLSFVFLVLWVVLLKLPKLLMAPQDVESWGGFGEIGIITAGSWALFAAHAGAWERAHLKFLVAERGILGARLLLIACMPMIGLVHFVFSGPTADFVPAWLPAHLAWAYITGSGSMLAAAGLLFGVWPRLAASMETVMLGIISTLCWGPLLSTGRTACTAFLISWAITIGAWLIADTYRKSPWLAIGNPSKAITLD